jgi:hypothetical protein
MRGPDDDGAEINGLESTPKEPCALINATIVSRLSGEVLKDVSL